MSKLTPVNDYFMVEIENNSVGAVQFAGGSNPEDGVREGKVVGISTEATYFGMNTYAFDKSLGDSKTLAEVHNHYRKFIGKKVYWPERSESGALITHGDKTYAFIKWSALMASEL